MIRRLSISTKKIAFGQELSPFFSTCLGIKSRGDPVSSKGFDGEGSWKVMWGDAYARMMVPQVTAELIFGAQEQATLNGGAPITTINNSDRRIYQQSPFHTSKPFTVNLWEPDNFRDLQITVTSRLSLAAERSSSNRQSLLVQRTQ